MEPTVPPQEKYTSHYFQTITLDMNKLFADLKKMARSRTLWTILIMFAFNLVDVFGAKIPPQFLGTVNFTLTALAAYFHITPRTIFTKVDQSNEVDRGSEKV